MIKNILLGLIMVTTALFSLAYLLAGQFPVAVFSLIAGAVWLALEARQQESAPSLFFLLFFGLAAVGGSIHLTLPVLLAGLCANIAAWDLSRFRTRIGNRAEGEAKALLESKHLQKLSLTTGLGFIIALLSTFVSISLNFVILVVLTLAMLLALRTSLLYLRKDIISKN